MKNKRSPMTRKLINSWNNVLQLTKNQYLKAKPKTNINNTVINSSSSIDFLQKLKNKNNH